MRHQLLAVQALQVLVRDRFADANLNLAADLVVHLLEKEREAQRHADMAGDLEHSAVLSGKIDRHDRGLGRDNESGGEVFPLGIDGSPAPRFGCRGGPSCGKYDETAAANQM